MPRRQAGAQVKRVRGLLERDYTGRTFRRATVMGLDHRDAERVAWWCVRCCCGTVVLRSGASLANAARTGAGLWCLGCVRGARADRRVAA